MRHCADVLQRLAAARGAINSIRAELIEGHIHNHMPPDSKSHNFNYILGSLFGRATSSSANQLDGFERRGPILTAISGGLPLGNSRFSNADGGGRCMGL